MKEFEKYEIKKGVSYICVPATRFKANEISLTFSVPLDEKTACVNAVLLNLISGCSKEYPDLLSLNRKLAMLYGASIHSAVAKQGNEQLLTINLSALDDRFSIDGDAISEEAVKLLISLLFEPKLDENGYFYESDIEREKRVVIQKLESEISDKRVYALRRLEEEMFKGEAYSLNASGTIEGVKAVTKESLKAALDGLIKCAAIQFLTVGSSDGDKTAAILKESFKNVERDCVYTDKAKVHEIVKESKTVSERQAVKQGKLVLGFRVNMDGEDEKSDAVRIFCDVFGGGPYSKLFMNVREKLSLCYYCSARYLRRNNSIIVQCGCEEENMEKAVNEILKQIEDIKSGAFEEEYNSSITAMCDSTASVYDDSAFLTSWYLTQITDKELLSPNAYIEKYKRVSFEDVKNDASLLSLDTVYKLMSVKEAE